MISLKSAIDGYSDISVGNALGSSICNVLLILGTSSLFKEIPMDRESMNVVIPLTLFSSVIILIFGNMNMYITRYEGMLLLGIFLIFMINIIIKRNEK